MSCIRSVNEVHNWLDFLLKRIHPATDETWDYMTGIVAVCSTFSVCVGDAGHTKTDQDYGESWNYGWSSEDSEDIRFPCLNQVNLFFL